MDVDLRFGQTRVTTSSFEDEATERIVPQFVDLKTDLENLCDQMRLSSDSNISDVALLGCP